MPDYSAYDVRNMAHARLLAAAPDLLKVCEELMSSGEYYIPIGLVARINAAITKAGGTALRTPDRCQWEEDGTWATSCGSYFDIACGTPSDNGMAFCPYCGRPIDAENANETGN